MTPVVYRTFDFDGGVIALFPADTDTRTLMVGSYQHVGQHGMADYNGVVSLTRPATEDEAGRLRDELVAIGYDDLKTYKRYRPVYLTLKR